MGMNAQLRKLESRNHTRGRKGKKKKKIMFFCPRAGAQGKRRAGEVQKPGLRKEAFGLGGSSGLVLWFSAVLCKHF